MANAATMKSYSNGIVITCVIIHIRTLSEGCGLIQPGACHYAQMLLDSEAISAEGRLSATRQMYQRFRKTCTKKHDIHAMLPLFSNFRTAYFLSVPFSLFALTCHCVLTPQHFGNAIKTD